MLGTRVLGRTGIEVSEVSVGTWAMGSEWGLSDDEASVRALHRALDLGCTLLDTAQAYGDHRSERLIARVFRERGSSVAVATKLPPKTRRWAPPPGTPIAEVYPPEYILEGADLSLSHLGVDVIDVYQLHTWLEDWNETDEWFEAMDRLKRQGKIRAIGISVRDGKPGEANGSIVKGRVDTVQVVYNILFQAPRKELFPVARAHNVGILARVPLASGALTGKFRRDTVFPPGDWRAQAFAGDTLERLVAAVERVKAIVGTETPLLTRALQFILADPEVSTVITGVRTVKQAEENLTALAGPALTEAQLSALRALELPRFPASPE